MPTTTVNQSTGSSGAPSTTGAGEPPKHNFFSWAKVYLANSLWSMVGCMIDNSDAIQDYVYNGLQKLSLVVAQASQAWSAFNMKTIEADEAKVKDDSTNNKDQVGPDTTKFNMDQGIYQMFLQFFSPLTDGLNTTASNGTQQLTADFAMITSGPIAMMNSITSCFR